MTDRSKIKHGGSKENGRRSEEKLKMPKQEFTDFDLLAGPICFVVFLIVILAMSVCCFNYFYILKDDELTTLEVWGYKRNLNWKLGPHSKKVIENKMAERRLLEDK